MRRRTATWTVPCIVVGLFVSSAARADVIEVTQEGCDGLDLEQLTEHLALELGDVVDTWDQAAPPRLELTCAGGEVEITIADPLTAKRVSRRAPLQSPSAEGSERLLALAASQLFTSSWLELLLPARRARVSDGASRARDRAEAALDSPPAAPFAAVRLALRTRDLGAPFTTAAAGLRGGLSFTRWSFFALAGVEAGTATRRQGEVTILLALLGVGAAYEIGPVGPFDLRAAAELLAGPFHFEGQPSAHTVLGHEENAGAVEARLLLGLAWPLSVWRLGLHLEVAVTVLAPDAEVTGEEDVRTSGLSLGLGLDVVVFP